MKVQTVIATLAVLAPMAVAAKDLFGGKYPYCTGCKVKYENEDGQWNYVDHTWCKVNEEKCNDTTATTTTTTCEPVDGYPCCSDSNTDVYYSDSNGNWGIENNNWCIIRTLLEFTDFPIELNSWLNLMPGTNMYGEGLDTKRRAYFRFNLGIKESEFKEKYEVEKVTINGEEIDIEKEMYYQKYEDAFRIDTHQYNEDFNTVEIIIRNKETNQSYLKVISEPLSKDY